MSIERMDSAAYKARQAKFVDVFNLHSMYDQLAFRSNLILVGPKGIAKTLSVQAYAHLKNIPIITFDCSEDVRRAQLLGHHILKGTESPFVLGPLTSAFEVANELGQCILVLEELSGLSPQMQKVLNPVSDFRKRIEVPECQTVFELKSNAKLWVVGTMNTAVYGGVYALNEDLKSRFRLLHLEYPSPAMEEQILRDTMSKEIQASFQKQFGKDADKVLHRVLQLAIESRQKSLEYALSPRDVVQVVEDIAWVGLQRAMRILIGKFDGEDRNTFKIRIHSTFGLTIDEGSAL